MKKLRFSTLPVLAALMCSSLVPAQAQWNKNSTAGPFDYATTANWNGGVINNAFQTNGTTGTIITFAAPFTLTSPMLLGWSNALTVTFQSTTSTPETIQLGASGGLLVTNAQGATINFGTTANPLVLDLAGSTNITLGGVAGTSGTANVNLNINAQIIDSVGGNNTLKLSGDRTFANLLNTNNSFVGPILFNALRGGSFANIKPIGGGPSALGAPTDTNNGTITASDANSNGSLKYTGSGDTSDRPFVFNMTFSNLLQNAYALINAGTGPLTLTGPWNFPNSTTNGSQFVIYAMSNSIILNNYIHDSGNTTNGAYTFLGFTGGASGSIPATNRIVLLGATNDFRDFAISNSVVAYNSVAASGVPSALGAGTNILFNGGNTGVSTWQGNSGQGSSLQYIGTTNTTFTRNVTFAGPGFLWALDNAGTNTTMTWSNSISWTLPAPTLPYTHYLFINSIATTNSANTPVTSTNIVYSYIPDANLTVSGHPAGITVALANPSGTTIGVNGGLVQLLNPTNTFAGGVQIAYARTLQATTLADIGLPSSIGTGAGGYFYTLGSFLVPMNGINLGSVDSSRGGVLSYIGTNAASCNQHFTIFGPSFNSTAVETCTLRNDSPNNSPLHFTDTTPIFLSPQGLTTGTNAYEIILSGTAATTNTLDTTVADMTNGLPAVTPNSGNLLVNGSAWRITAAQAYTGSTIVNTSTLLVDGSIAAGLVTTVGAGGTLTGTGVINENVNVLTNGTITAGDGGIGALTINGNLTNAGTIFMKLNKTLGTNDQLLLGGNTLAYGGVLSITNLAGTLTTNDSFQLFNAGTYTGSFASVSPATPGAGLAWDLSSLLTGKLKITTGAPANPPTIGSIHISGANATISGSNGSLNGTYYILATTNILQPGSNWVTIATNNFDGSGNFNFILTNVVQTNVPAEFFRLRVP